MRVRVPLEKMMLEASPMRLPPSPTRAHDSRGTTPQLCKQLVKGKGAIAVARGCGCIVRDPHQGNLRIDEVKARASTVAGISVGGSEAHTRQQRACSCMASTGRTDRPSCPP